MSPAIAWVLVCRKWVLRKSSKVLARMSEVTRGGMGICRVEKVQVGGGALSAAETRR